MSKIIHDDIQLIIASEYIDWDRFRGKTILITGATGMLPSYIALTLLELNRTRGLGCKILAVCRSKDKFMDIYHRYSAQDGIELINQDVTVPINHDGDIHFIVHAASQASPKYYGTDPVGTLNANIIGTHNLLQLAKDKGSESFLFFSTGGVYGEVSGESISESDYGPINPLSVRNCYFESKRMAENMCVSYNHQYHTHAKIVRIFHTLGPLINLNDGRAFSDFCKAVVERKDIVLRSKGEAVRSFGYAVDAATAFFLILLKGVDSDAYNVGGGIANETSIRDLAEMLAREYKSEGIDLVYDINPADLTYGLMKTPVHREVPDTTKLENLGWRRRFSTLDAFKRTITSIAETRKS